MRIGYKLATERFGPKELIRQAVLAEQAGFKIRAAPVPGTCRGAGFGVPDRHV